MLSFVYSLFILIGVVFSLPLVLYQKIFLKKKIPLFKKFFVPSVDAKLSRPVVWVHAVSLGEMKLAASIIQKLQERHSFTLVATTQTKTGYDFAKSVFLKNVFYLPIDLPFLQRRLVKKIKPDLFFLIESDFWYQQLKFMKKQGAKVFLLNGKMSDRSFSRWKNIPKIAGKLFNHLDVLFVQDLESKEKFSAFVDPSKVEVTGNLKLVKKVQEKKGLFPFLNERKVIVIACTHENEEIELYEALKPLIQEGWVFIFAPRHPERFSLVYSQLKAANRATLRISTQRCSEVLLVDQLGILNELYHYSTFAVMGGSYGSKKGGHDIFEPILAGVYVFFGPHMQSQRYLKKLAIENHLAEEKVATELVKAIRLKGLEQQKSFRVDLEKFKGKIKSDSEEFFKKIENYLSA